MSADSSPYLNNSKFHFTLNQYSISVYLPINDAGYQEIRTAFKIYYI